MGHTRVGRDLRGQVKQSKAVQQELHEASLVTKNGTAARGAAHAAAHAARIAHYARPEMIVQIAQLRKKNEELENQVQECVLRAVCCALRAVCCACVVANGLSG